MSFETLGLSEELQSAVRTKGYTTPSPIQEKAIPVILQGKDILAAAQTGTGKTAGFTLPMLHLMSQKTHTGSGRRPIRALVVTPTRELAAQIQENVLEYGKNLDLRSIVIFGGVSAKPQIRSLRDGVDILVATPGRLLDLQNQRYIDLSKVEFLVLDEADRMLDMGFIHDIKKVLALLPKKRQNLLFSATFSPNIRTLASKFMDNPVSVDVAPRNTAAESVKQTIYMVHKKRKVALLKHLIKKGEWKQVLIFTRTKHGANRLAKRLASADIPALAIHGNKSQNARTHALKSFKNGEVQVLVATDIAARGLDIEQLPWVVNYELPNVPEDYVHRIGRTGRAGQTGEAISLVFDQDENKLLRDIERLLNKSIPKEVLEDFDYTVKIDPEEEHRKREDRGRGGRGRNNNRGGRGNNNRGRNDRKTSDRKPSDRNASDRKPNERNSNDRKSNDDRRKTDNREADGKDTRTREKQPAGERSGSSDRKEENGKRENNRNNRDGKNKSRNQRNRNKSNKSKSKSSKEVIPEGNKKSKGVAFSKASKDKKYGKKGPLGYGMYPLE